MTFALTGRRVHPSLLAEAVAGRVADGGRFAGLVATARGDGSTVLRALVAVAGRLEVDESLLGPGETRYPALTPLVPAAAWYEREIHDVFGLQPEGHPRLDPLVLPLPEGAQRPRPGAPGAPGRLELDTAPLPGHVSGEGVFTIPYGPVRSGVFETIEYLVETTGEEIPHLRTRVYQKHRGLDRRFGDLGERGEIGAEDVVLLAERVEGTCSVAHALACCQALESAAEVEPPRPAALVRVVHAELERVAVHLDSIVRHTEGAGQAVAYARISRHKEEVLRLRARLCGHRFGRGVVVPGGVAGGLQMGAGAARAQVDRLQSAIDGDTRVLMETASFLDRLRGTGPLPAELAVAEGALGPVGRGSGAPSDVRAERPYGAYRHLDFEAVAGIDQGDALARQHVRVAEIRQAFDLVRQALGQLDGSTPAPWRGEVLPSDGVVVSSVEAPQGELVYLMELEGGRIRRVKPRCASFHNLPLFARAFQGDIFTDFVFIEASFGLSFAGVSG
ncbi:MAG: NADH-quinone oxidoreductase subunit C [Acidimicrobiales bacterium]